MWDGDELDSLDRGSLTALVQDVRQAQAQKRARGGARKKKIRNGTQRFEWENLEGVGLTQTIKVEIELPAYMVAGMQGLSYRQAVRDHLIRNGRTWWYPRFAMVLKSKEIEAANRRFTKQSGLE